MPVSLSLKHHRRSRLFKEPAFAFPTASFLEFTIDVSCPLDSFNLSKKGEAEVEACDHNEAQITAE